MKIIDCFCRYGYPDFTYLSRVRSELAAKGVGSASASSAAVTSSASATATSLVSKPSKYMSSTSSSVAGSRDRDTASAPRHASHNKAYSTLRSSDFDGRSTPGVSSAQSSAAVSSLDSANQYGIGTSISSRHQPYSLSTPSSSSNALHSSAVGFGGARPLHAASTVDRINRGSVAGSTFPSAGGNATRASHRDDYDRLHMSRVLHSSSNAASLHSTISATGTYDSVRRHR